MVSLAIWSNKHFENFQILQRHLPDGIVQFVVFEKIIVLINTKLYSKSCSYLCFLTMLLCFSCLFLTLD